MARPMTHPMSKEEIMSAIQECAEKLQRVPSQSDLIRTTTVSQRMIVKQFGTYTRALRACNLERYCGGNKITMEALFNDWAVVVRTLKKIPSKAEFENLGRYSLEPLKKRFGNWTQVPAGLKHYIEAQGKTEECQDLLGIIAEFERERENRDWGLPPVCTENKPRLIPGRPVYGPLLRPFPAMHGPTEEQGVVYLFGTMSERLGFVVLHIQKAFPDCEALREVGEGMWQRVIIEFEYESLNFVKHGHDASKCDIIVCWKHNWPECPLEVVELSKLVKNF
jgi:Homing endonuclease associated repeat